MNTDVGLNVDEMLQTVSDKIRERKITKQIRDMKINHEIGASNEVLGWDPNKTGI